VEEEASAFRLSFPFFLFSPFFLPPLTRLFFAPAAAKPVRISRHHKNCNPGIRFTLFFFFFSPSFDSDLFGRRTAQQDKRRVAKKSNSGRLSQSRCLFFFSLPSPARRTSSPRTLPPVKDMDPENGVSPLFFFFFSFLLSVLGGTKEDIGNGEASNRNQVMSFFFFPFFPFFFCGSCYAVGKRDKGGKGGGASVLFFLFFFSS